MKVICTAVVTLILYVNEISLAQTESCPGVISRDEWGGRRPEHVEYLLRPVKNVVIQHTVTPQCTTASSCAKRVRNMQAHHMDELGFNDLGMSFNIGDDGGIYEAPGWHKVGAHTNDKWNNKSIAIAFIGNFQEKLPTQAALDAAKSLLECGVEKKLLSSDYRLYAHLQLYPTLSPGEKLYQEIRKWPHWSRNVV